ncbi:MAG: polysaccharide pyruvyl transferase family protein [Lachnospiraceae bacterium]|nr:polysaccharide pyruvyl transferase family protein [Lachnospiraceae bacterium]
MKRLEKDSKKNIMIIGWYGTETLGDRAILDGILYLLNKIYPKAHVSVGSLKPFFTERTLYEDRDLYAQTAPQISIDIFDVRDLRQLRREVRKSDIVMMGGGPLMDIDEMYIIKDAFCYAKRKRKKTMLLGCGYGPLNRPDCISCCKKILQNSDVSIFRDEFSRDYAMKICQRDNIIYLPDPAIFSVLQYKELHRKKNANYIAVNVREYANVYGEQNFSYISELIRNLNKLDKKIILVPMHSFFWGGDDREFFIKILDEYQMKNVEYVHQPLSLEELYELYMNAEGCVGMRYHSILIQTILNGRNIVIDYSGKDGKIQGFFAQYDKKHFYYDKMVDAGNYRKFDWHTNLLTEESFDFVLSKEYEKEYIERIKE